MKSKIRLSDMYFFTLILTLFLLFSAQVFSQTSFIRDDNFDFRGVHYLNAVGSNPSNASIVIESNTDFLLFKLHYKPSRVLLRDVIYPWNPQQVWIDMNNDGNWEFLLPGTDETTVQYLFPDPGPGISLTNNIRVRIIYKQFYTGFGRLLDKLVPVTIFSKPRVYTDADKNSFVQLRDEDCSGKIPVLMLEGFDPTNEKYPENYYCLTRDLIDTDLYPNGYEVFILNFADGGRDLRSNVNVFLKAVEKVHEICPKYKIAVAGLSMGGVIARYALAKKEELKQQHDVGLFLSYDSPQRWAHVNGNLQDWIKEQEPAGVLAILQANLNSVAAKQMLGYNTYDRSHTFRNQFYDEMNALNGDGYPHQCYNAAVSNGNFKATWGNESIGRHLMTLKINDLMVYDVAAVEWDCETGSMITDITMKRHGDIFTSPFFSIYYDLEIIFNPAYTPTWSALDLQDWFDDPYGNIIKFKCSKFDDYVIQTVPLQHHELSLLTRQKINYWLSKDFKIALNYNLPEGGNLNPENQYVNILHGLPLTVQPKNVNINGKQVSFNFAEWWDKDKSNPRTFFTSHDSSVSVTMKGIQISNDAASSPNNSPRKIVRSSDGKLHLVYASMGHVWYEISSNNGATWQLANGGKALDLNGAKNPTIDYYPNGSSVNNIVISFQSNNSGNAEITTQLYKNGTFQYKDSFIPQPVNSFSYDLAPVISYGVSGKLVLIWRDDKLFYRFGSVGSRSLTWYSNPGTVQNTDAGSRVAAISNTKFNSTFHLVWEQSYAEIRYSKLTVNSNGNGIQFSDYAVISTGCGFSVVFNPSVAVYSGDFPSVVWIGTPYYNSGFYRVIQRTGTASGWSSSFYQYDDKAANPVINMTDNGTTCIPAWSTTDGNYTKFVRNGSIKSFGLPGRYIQLANGPDLNTMYGSVYRNTAVPYTFTTTPAVGRVVKETAENIFSGRSLIVTKDNAFLYYTLSDICIAGKKAGFNCFTNEFILEQNEEVEKYLTSDLFSINELSELTFNTEIGISDSVNVKNLFKGNSYIKFSAELLDEFDNVLGRCSSILLNKNNFSGSKNESYRFNLNGIKNKRVKLRIKTENNLKAVYTIANILDDDGILKKTDEQNAFLNEEKLITEYKLAQNYPNPFNPATKITYQLPEDGFVTIKVYDILGSEVKILLSDYKTAGKYEVDFNAASAGGGLASGVYFYSLTADKFHQVKKMILAK